MNRVFSLAVNAILLTLIISNPAHADKLALPAADVIAPVVEQNDFVSKIESGKDHKIRVTATDNVAIKSVILYYRDMGAGVYQTKTMHKIIDTDDYETTLDAEEITGDGIEYYIQATDTAGNTLLLGYAFSPLTILVDRHAADIQLADTAASTVIEPVKKIEKERSYKWLWIGLGVLAAGAAIAANSGGGDSGSSGSQGPTVVVNAPVP